MSLLCLKSVLFLAYLAGILAFFDLEEINTVNYGIDILDAPVVFGQEAQGGSVMLASRYGQQYQCTFSEKSREKEQQEKEDEKVAMETGIPELLKPMENGPCLINTKGWWTYEFCFGKHIKQFHLEDGKITGQVMYLGHYFSDYDWSNTTKLRKQRSWLSRYHSQQYMNGSQCDLTGKSRRTEVRFHCEETAADYISRIDETETCVYTVSVRTARICNHPYLKPPAPHKAVPISCHPVLSQDDYDDYLASKAEEERLDLLRRQQLEEKRLIQKAEREMEAKMRAKASDSEAESGDFEVPATELQNLISKSLIDGLKEVFGEEDNDDIHISSMKVKTFKNSGDVNSIIKDVLKEAKTADGIEKGAESEEGAESGKGAEPKEGGALQYAQEEDEEEEEEEEMDPDDQALLAEFDKGLDELVETESQLRQIQEYKDQLETEINDQFDEILQEAEAELEMDLDNEGEIDTDAAIKTMSQTLNKLLKQLDKKVMKGDKGVAESPDTDTDILADDTGDVSAMVDADSAMVDADSAMVDADTGVEDAEFEEDEEYINMEYDVNFGEIEREAEELVEKQAENTQKHYQVTTFADGSFKVTTKTVGDESGDGTEESYSATGEKIANKPEAPKTSPKSQVKEAKSREHKIQVKIFTSADYYEDVTADMLDGGNSLNKMIVAVLGGNSDEIKEAQRQEQMESNYEFKWKANKNKSPAKQAEEETDENS